MPARLTLSQPVARRVALGVAACALALLGAAPTTTAARAPQAGQTRQTELPPGNAQMHVPLGVTLGDTLLVEVEGFTPSAEVSVLLMGPGPTARLLPVVRGSAITDREGRGGWTVRVPDDLALLDPDGWWLNADDAVGRFANRAVEVRLPGAPLRVVAAPALPDAAAPPAPAFTEPAAPAEVFEAPRASGDSEWMVVRGEAAASAAATMDPGGRVFTTSVALRLRAAPGTDAPILGGVAPGSTLRLTGGSIPTAEAEFYPVVTAAGTSGYVAPDPDDLPGAAPPSSGEVYRLRIAPSESAPVLGLVPLGTRVRVLDVGATWTRVEVSLNGMGTQQGFLPTRVLASR